MNKEYKNLRLLPLEEILELPERYTDNKHFQDLPQYHFERDDFTKVFSPIMDFIYDNMYCSSDDFEIKQRGDEFYIIHYPSGTIINWYKNPGRCNTCNKPLSLDDLKEFKRLLLLDFDYEEI